MTDAASGAGVADVGTGMVLVERDDVLAQCGEALDQAAAGSASVVTVAGDPGSGKTALCEALAGRATRLGFGVCRTAGVEGELDLPLAGLSILLRPLLRDVGSALDVLPAGQRRALRTAAGLAEDVVADRFTLGAGLLGLFSIAAERRPLLVLADDVQWLDPASADALSFALRRLGADAVAVVLAFRAGPKPVEVPPGSVDVQLGGLPLAGVSAMMRHAGLGATSGVCAEIHAATAGLPLAVLETARALSVEERCGAVPLPDPLPIGRRVTEAYHRRLARLPERTRRAVAAVATAGPVGRATLVVALDHLGVTIADLLPAESAEVLAVTADGVVFSHPLLRAAGLDLLPGPDRRAMHRALAIASGDDPERRARHLLAAADGPDDDVAAALELAAAHAQRRAGPAAAAPLLERAAAFGAPGEVRAARQLAAAQALGLAGRSADAVRTAREVMAATTDPLRRADAALVVVDSAFWGTSAEELFDLAVGAAEQIVPLDRNRAIHALGRACISAAAQGALGTSEQLGGRAVALLTADTPADIRAEATDVYAASLVLTGRHAQARALLEGWTPPLPGAVTAAAVRGIRYPVAIQTLVRLGYLRAAEQLVRVLLEVCQREATPSAASYVLDAATEMWWWRGSWPRALAIGDEAATLAEQTGQPVLAGYARANTARVLAGQGAEERCRARVEDALQVARVYESGVLRAFALAALGLLELSLGAPTAAIPPLLEVAATFRASGCGDPAVVPHGADLVEALARAGENEQAQAALDEHRARAETSGLPWAAATTARSRALLASDPDEQDEQFAVALELHPPDIPFDTARTRLYWGEYRRRRRDIAGCRPLLHEAWTIFDRLGARPWAARSAAELRAAGAAPRAMINPIAATLSPQELRCALAVTDGMRNREAAAALFISPKTVEYHLAKVYAKLGVRSRTQLAKALERHLPRTADQ